MINLEIVTRTDQIKVGDFSVLEPKCPDKNRHSDEIIRGVARKIVITPEGAVEVVFNMAKNRYFNVGMMLKGESYIDNAYILRKT